MAGEERKDTDEIERYSETKNNAKLIDAIREKIKSDIRQGERRKRGDM